MSLSPNATIGHYTIISKTGAGGMGEVYRARDTRLDREVAIKLFPAQVSSDSDRLTRFEQEARATSALNHPNILTVYDIGTHDGSPYIVAELLEGEELRDRLNAGSLPLRKVIKELFFVAPDGRLMSVEIASGSSFEPGKPKPLFEPRASQDNSRHPVRRVRRWAAISFHQPHGRSHLVGGGDN